MAKRGPKPKKPAKPARPAKLPAGWTPPRHLSGEAAAAWRHVVGLLHAAGNLDRTDPTLVECYAVNRALLRSSWDMIQTDGPTVLNGAGCPVNHPAQQAINAATMRLKALISDFGLCPATSKAPASAPAADDKWGGLIGVAG